MNQRKPNSSLRYSLGLAIVLCTAALVISMGTTFARYRTEKNAELTFAVREEASVWVGTIQTDTVAGTEVFQPQDELYWEYADNAARLNMVIANGTSESLYAGRDLEVQFRFVGTLAFWQGMEPAKMYVTIPSEKDPNVMETLQAVATPIVEGTALHYKYGDGLLYTIQDANGEIARILPGGKLSCIEVTITMENLTTEDAAQLSPLITSRVVG